MISFTKDILNEITQLKKNGDLTSDYIDEVREGLNYLLLNEETGKPDSRLITPEITQIFQLLNSFESSNKLEGKLLLRGRYQTPVCNNEDNFMIADYMVVRCRVSEDNYSMGIGLNILPTGNAYYHKKDLQGKKILARHPILIQTRLTRAEKFLERSILKRMSFQFSKSRRTRGGTYFIFGKSEVEPTNHLEYFPGLRRGKGDSFKISSESDALFRNSIIQVYGHILEDFGRKI